MRVASFRIRNSESRISTDTIAYTTAEGVELRAFRKRFTNPDIPEVEGVVVEMVPGDEWTELTVLMSEDHAARLAVSEDATGAIWGDDA